MIAAAAKDPSTVSTHGIYMLAEVKRWGNSYAIRLTKGDLERLGLHEGDAVQVDLQAVAPSGRIDLSHLPRLDDPDPSASERHDAHLYGPRGEAG